MNTTSKPYDTAVIWLTGLSGAGKSAIAEILVTHLEKQNRPVELLDGDLIRSIFPQTGFSKSERNEHIKRVAFTASRLEHHGITVVVSLISPYEESREFAKKICQNFIEVHVSTPLEVCQQRDPKGLYRKFHNGDLKNMVGLDEVYESPIKPNVVIDTTNRTAQECAFEILRMSGYQIS